MRRDPFVVIGRNQLIAGELICAMFGGIAISVTDSIDVDRRSLVFQDVACLVEKAEPELVVGLVAQAQRDHGLLWTEPSGHAADSEFRQRGNEREGHAGSRTQIPEPGLELLGWSRRELTGLV